MILSVEGHDDYIGYTLNLDSMGVATYVSFPFNSLMDLDGELYGLTSTGLFKLVGDSDAGDPIEAQVVTGGFDFGALTEKNVIRAYLNFVSPGKIMFRTLVTQDGAIKEVYYEVDAEEIEYKHRVLLGRGVRGTHWQFVLENIAGSSLDLKSVEVVPVNLFRR